MHRKEAKSGVSYDSNSLQIDVTGNVADAMLQFSKRYVPASVIFTDEDGSKGREDSPHVTVLYGMTGDPKEIEPQIRELLADIKPFNIKFGKVSRFTTSPQYDVLKIDVDASELIDLNALVRKNIPHEATFLAYRPHMTIAYIKKGFLVDLSGNTDFVGSSFKVHAVTFSGKEKSGTSIIHLKG